jgi:hypothetical protein
VDLFTDQEDVEAVADAVEKALRGAGFVVERQEAEDGRLADVLPDTGQGLAEWIITAAGGKVCALASRVEPRDYADSTRMLERYSPAELIGVSRRLDPGLTARDFPDAGRQLDHIDDEAFTRYGLAPGEVAVVRERFAAWPRTAEAARREMQAREPGRQNRKAAPDPGTRRPAA